MAERFLKFIPSQEALWLLKKKGHAFRLLAIIAESARRYEGDPDGLNIGECFIGGHENYDMTEQNYRTAKDILVKRQHLEIVETCRTRKKSTTGSTTVGTKVKLLSSNVWDINLNEGNDRVNDCPTTDQRPTNDKQEREERQEREEDHHPYPSCDRTDDFSSKKEKLEIIAGVFMSPEDWDSCIKIKGSIEKAREAIAFIQASKKRKHPIADWPNALARWKIENKPLADTAENVFLADKLCRDFEYFERGWRCRISSHAISGIPGLIFENESPYKEPTFVSLADGEFKQKCHEFMEKNSLTRK